MRKWFLRIVTAIMMLSCVFMSAGCENIFQQQSNSEMQEEKKAVFYLLPPTTDGQMMGCVIQTIDKKTIVIDGGTRGDSEQLMDFILEKADAHVDAWFFTHPHQDHLGAFCNIFKNTVGITVDKIYHHFPTIFSFVF